MKELKYIDNIFNDIDDFEGGLLNSLNAEPSVDLHDAVMRNIKLSERRLMKRFNYKKYLSVAAAIVIFVSGLGRMAYVGLQRDKAINIAAQNELKPTTEVKDDTNKLTASIENVKPEKENIQNEDNSDKKITNLTSSKSVEPKTKKTEKKVKTDNILENTTAIVAKEDKINSSAQHNDNIYGTLSEVNLNYEYEVYLTDEDKSVLDYINANSLWITAELYSFDAMKFEDFKKYAEENKLEIKPVNLDKQNSIANEIIVRIIKK